MTAMHGSQDTPSTSRVASWPGRMLYGLVAITVLVIGFFFLTIALVAGALVALVILARLWWISRRPRPAQELADIEGEFAVIEQREAIQQIESPRRPQR